MSKLTANGYPLNTDSEAFAELRPSNEILDNSDALRQRMDEEGYLFFRGLLPRDEVLRARREILLQYAAIGELDPKAPLMDAIYSEDSAVGEVNLRAFSESVR